MEALVKALQTCAAGGLLALAASCVPNPVYEQRAAARTQAELSRELAGRVAGAPQSCLPEYSTSQLNVIDNNTLIYRDGRTVWVQRPRGGCSGLANSGNTLVTRKFGTSQMCDGDISQVVDLRTGMLAGSCVFGPFVPYTKPR